MTPGRLQARADRLLFAVTLFLSAALLFAVEPMVAKGLLPRFGGAPAVWNTSLVFFQTVLLAGYAYVYLTARLLQLRDRAIGHVLLLVAAGASLAVFVRGTPAVSGESSPAAAVLMALSVSVGVPFFALSSTTPLLQSWSASADGDTADPYRLYSASNVGSFVGLIAYPVLIEPALDLDRQRVGWATAFAVVVLLIAACAWRASARVAARVTAGTSHARIGWPDRWRWVVLALLPASLTIGLTTYISTDIAAIPLVWIMPLLAYLSSLAIAFVRPRVARATRLLLPVVLLAPMVWFYTETTRMAWIELPVHVVAVFLLSLACHQALAASRPDPVGLPEFFLWVAVGGAVGGLVTALAAPLVFRTPVEYPIAMLAACYCGTRDWGRTASALPPGQRGRWMLNAAVPAAAAGCVLLASAATSRLGWAPNSLATLTAEFAPATTLASLVWIWPLRYVLTLGAVLAASAIVPAAGRAIHVERNFFGVHRVVIDPTGQFRELLNGTTVHGLEAIDRATHPDGCLSYYTPGGPAGQVFDALARTRPAERVAVLGLGAGSLGCYATRSQQWTFFEIDPAVERLAREYFTYLPQSNAKVDTIIGDARLSLSAWNGPPFDVMVFDTFSSDAVPVHLLTREALRVYLDHLAPGGVLLIHISNLYIELEPVVGRLTSDAGLVALVQRHRPGADRLREGIFPSTWVVAARHDADLRGLARDPRWQAVARSGPLWTDRSSDLFTVLRYH